MSNKYQYIFYSVVTMLFINIFQTRSVFANTINNTKLEEESQLSKSNSNCIIERFQKSQENLFNENIFQKTRASERRIKGCKQPIKVNKLYLLAPRNLLAATNKQRPTFYIYLDKVPSQPIRYSINSQERRLFEEIIHIEKKGVVPITLPPNVTLEATGQYYLTLGIICNREIPVKDFHINVKFAKVNVNQNIQSKMPSNIYWYDLLDFAYKSQDDRLFLLLAHQVGFNDIELN